ncbi:MAG: hypothetical protein ABIS47_05040 [Acidimicrobiales bacterium]
MSTRRTVFIICAVVALVAVLGAFAYASGSVGNGCGSAFSASRKPIPSPLLSPQDVEKIKNEKLNPYEFGLAKSAPVRECRRAGEHRLITAGLGSLGLLLPALGVFIFSFLYWPGDRD